MPKSYPTEDLGIPLKYDPDFKGPIKSRSCTDIICLLLFLVFIGGWIGIGSYAISKGDLDTLLVPRDSNGSRCGVDSHVRDKKYLFFFDLTKCIDPSTPFTGCKTTQICVDSCPDKLYYEGMEDKDTKYCVDENENDCPQWYLPSNSFQHRCLPKLSNLTNVIKEIKEHIDATLDENGITTAVKNIKLFSQAEEIGQNVVEDIVSSWWKILIGIGIGVLVSIIFILLMRWIATPMVWISIIGVVVALGAGVYFSAREYIKYKDESNKYKEDNSGIFSNYVTNKNLWLSLLIIASVMLGIVLLILLFLRKRILLAVALIKEGSKAVSAVTSVLFFPLFPWILQLGVVAYGIFVGLYLSTTGDAVYGYRNNSDSSGNKFCTLREDCEPLKENDPCDPDNIDSCYATCMCKFLYVDNPSFFGYLQAYNVVGLFWGYFFVIALGQMILASVFATWYWTFKKSNVAFFAVTAATGRTLRYNLGTVAFGSLIITICRLIRVALEYVDQKLKKYDNSFTKAIMCCLKCFFWCLEKFLKFINKNAYIMCAIHGKNFCSSAKDAFSLLMRNIIRVFVLDKITDFLFFLSKVFITVGVGSIAYICFATDYTGFDNSDLKYEFVPVVMIMFFTYLITSIFFSVYSMAVDTLFLCFLEDCERNDGSAQKPYYMSRSLMNVLGKKNKRD